jgi:hypothetical protein
MKKAIGLTADVSTFNTTLPQTRHLNYFLNTNPQRFAKGGDVKAGIPNYPNPNVTSGFLPMALGFDNGGEANSGLLQQIDKLMLILGGDMKKVIEYLKRFFGYTDEEINSALNQKDTQEPEKPSGEQLPSNRQPGIDIANQMQPQPVTPKDTVTATPSDRQPGIGISNNMTPLVPSDRQGAFDNVPMQPLPKISTEQQQREYEDSQKPTEPKPQITPPNDGGITSITPSDRQPGIGIANEMKPKEELPFYLKAFDLNGDGKVDMQDLNIAKEKGLAIADAIAKFLGLDETDPEDLPDIEINPDLEDDKKEIKPELKIKPQPDGGGITELPKVSEEQIKRDKEDKQTGLSVEDQKTLKAGADIAAGGDGGIKDKKDVPAWALPMMSAGFAMMASKSPYFMQALGEAGQAGLETFTAQKTAEEDKLDKESARDLQKSQAAYYRGEGRQPSSKTMVQGGIVGQIKNGVWEPIMDSTTNKPLRATIGRAEAIEMLSKNEMYNMASPEDKKKMIQEYIDIYNNTNTFINDKLVEQDGGGIGLGTWVKDWLGLKDGGIVSIRR